MALLKREFYERDVVEVARDLLGKIIRRQQVALRITEVEAYRWPGDTACHARAGRTPRNEALWGPPGRAYVYLCYGLHNLLNIVTGPEHAAAAVLVRACEPVAGAEVLQRRRRQPLEPASLAGPGKVGQALDLDVRWSHHVLFRRGPLMVEDGPRVATVLVGPRIGIDYALPEHRALPWRFADGDSLWVSHRAKLKPETADKR